MKDTDLFVLARVMHVLGVVLWIGGVAFVTTVLLPSLRCNTDPARRLELFENLEGRFAWQARIVTLVTGITGFYMLHFLTDDAWKHDQAWIYFAMGTKVAIAKAGGTAGGMDEGYPMQRRPSALYIILSFVTFGLFLVFWWYATVKDTNDHYARQARFEDELLAYFSGKN